MSFTLQDTNLEGTWSSAHYTITIHKDRRLVVESRVSKATGALPKFHLVIKLTSKEFTNRFEVSRKLQQLSSAIKCREFRQLCEVFWADINTRVEDSYNDIKKEQYQKQYNELMGIDSTTLTPLTPSTIPKDETRLT